MIIKSLKKAHIFGKVAIIVGTILFAFGVFSSLSYSDLIENLGLLLFSIGLIVCGASEKWSKERSEL